MSVCIPCPKVLPVPKCHGDITIGTVAGLNTDYYIYVRDNTTGRVQRMEATSDGAGLLKVLAANNKIKYAKRHTYEVYITLKTASSPQDREDFTISGAASACTCVTLRVEPTFTGEEPNSFPAIVITLA